MMVYTTEQAEFSNSLLKISVTMMNPFASQGKKRKALCGMVDNLSSKTFTSFIPEIIEMINKKKDECKKYPDSESQVNSILEWLPRLKEYREILLEVIKEHREKYGLKC